MTLDRKILLGLTSCSLILVFVAVMSFRNGEEFINTSQWVSHTHEVLYELDQVLLNAINAQTGARGYVITGNESYLEPVTYGKADLIKHFRSLMELTRDNAVQQENLAELKPWIDQHLANIEHQVSLRRDTAGEQTRIHEVSGAGKEIMDEIRDRLRQCKDLEQKLLEQRRLESEAGARNFNLLFSMLLGVILLVLLVVYSIIITNLKALRKADKEAQERNWNLTGTAELTRDMQGNLSIPELSRKVIHHLATYLHAQTGALYIADPEQQTLRLAGAYALDKSKSNTPHVRYHEGIVGQAAAGKTQLLLSDIPPDYFTLNTSFGNAKPKNIIAQPFVFEHTLMGVIEIGTTGNFTEQHRQYLALSADSIAIAFNSSVARAKAANLLEETQLQSEELEAQREELRQSNEELFAKTELLEKSEMELRTQQEELRQTNEILEQRALLLEDQKRALEDAKAVIEVKAREIETTSKYKSEFLANMSHELRTPLNSMLILAQLLAENKNNALDKKEMEFARNILTSGKDLLTLINEILDLSKIEAGKLQLDVSEVPLQQVVSNTHAMFTELARSRGINFRIDYQPETMPAALTTDQQRLEQVLRNLLSNAFKFTAPGGNVTLHIDSPSVNNIPTPIEGPFIMFAVTDTGIGIPYDKQGIIFEAFQQADGSTKRKYGGTGLGLSISRELVNALGGTIRLFSKEGKGSTFTVYLPIAFNGTKTPAEEREVARGPGAQKANIRQSPPPPALLGDNQPQYEVNDDRHLLVDKDHVIVIAGDDHLLNTGLLDMVRKRGYKGIMARPTTTGVGYVRHYRPDAMLLDFDHDGSGTETLRHIKHDHDLRHVPVIVLSAEEHRKEALAQGAFDFLIKPVSPAMLQHALEKIEKFSTRKYKKLLIVEDNEQHNEAIRQLMGNGDVICSSAYQGNEAFNMLIQDSYDCIIVDLGLPDMSGLDLLEKIKVDNTLNKIPVIVYTGMDLSKEVQARLTRLANTVVLKTADSQERLLDEATLFLHREQSKLPQEAQSLMRKLHQPDDMLKDKRILIVDDDMRNIYSLTNALEEEGVRCVTAENGRVALDVLGADPSVDLVLMDIMMPEMDGYETTQAIRKSDSLRKMPIIALTAKAMKGDREKCLAAGMSDYISKPVDIRQLLGLLKIWLYK